MQSPLARAVQLAFAGLSMVCRVHILELLRNGCKWHYYCYYVAMTRAYYNHQADNSSDLLKYGCVLFVILKLALKDAHVICLVKL